MESVRQWIRSNAVFLSTSVLVLILILIYLAPNIFIVIYPGQAGVLWRRFGGGTDVTTVYPEGLRMIFPWDIMYIYDIRMQQKGETFDVLSSDGLTMQIDLTVRFRLIEQDLGLLHKHIGPDYIETLLMPEIRAHARAEAGQYLPEQIYTSNREQIMKSILDTVRKEMLIKYMPEVKRYSFIYLEDVFIRSITLPRKVQMAIQDKLAQKHKMEEYTYRLQKEEKEAQRKRIEAEGIRDFQNIIKNSIDTNYLKWKGIDATLQMANSNNAKIVVIGAGNDGLPIILGGLDSPVAKPKTHANTDSTAPTDYPFANDDSEERDYPLPDDEYYQDSEPTDDVTDFDEPSKPDDSSLEPEKSPKEALSPPSKLDPLENGDTPDTSVK